MRSLSTVLGTAVLSGALFLGSPNALAWEGDDVCGKAVAAADKAEAAYKAALKEYQQIIDDGGHPDKSQRDNVKDLKSKRDATASQAARACEGEDAQEPSKAPSGKMHTGTGSTSRGIETDEAAAAGAAGLLVAGAWGAWLMHRRRRQDQS